MGKKSKRKATRAGAGGSAAAAAGRSGNSLVLGPRPDGITCTNEDPNVCILCSAELSYGFDHINLCCGTRECSSCYEHSRRARCFFCGADQRYKRTVCAELKKRAKEGFPWACNVLAFLYSNGLTPIIEVSNWDAFFWYEKASEMGHPDACRSLGMMYARGDGCKRNLDMAQNLFEKAVRLAPDFMPQVLNSQCKLALTFFEEKKVDRAISLLTSLANEGMGMPQYLLGIIFEHINDKQNSLCWLRISSKNFDSPIDAMKSSISLTCLPLAGFWYRRVSSDSLSDSDSDILRKCHSILCDLRQICATCKTELDRTNRKLCAGCKAICYCSIECQTAHWTASGGHRDECKEVSVLKDKVRGTRVSHTRF